MTRPSHSTSGRPWRKSFSGPVDGSRKTSRRSSPAYSASTPTAVLRTSPTCRCRTDKRRCATTVVEIITFLRSEGGRRGFRRSSGSGGGVHTHQPIDRRPSGRGDRAPCPRPSPRELHPRVSGTSPSWLPPSRRPSGGVSPSSRGSVRTSSRPMCQPSTPATRCSSRRCPRWCSARSSRRSLSSAMNSGPHPTRSAGHTSSSQHRRRTPGDALRSSAPRSSRELAVEEPGSSRPATSSRRSLSTTASRPPCRRLPRPGERPSTTGRDAHRPDRGRPCRGERPRPRMRVRALPARWPTTSWSGPSIMQASDPKRRHPPSVRVTMGRRHRPSLPNRPGRRDVPSTTAPPGREAPAANIICALSLPLGPEVDAAHRAPPRSGGASCEGHRRGAGRRLSSARLLKVEERLELEVRDVFGTGVVEGTLAEGPVMRPRTWRALVLDALRRASRIPDHLDGVGAPVRRGGTRCRAVRRSHVAGHAVFRESSFSFQVVATQTPFPVLGMPVDGSVRAP